MRKAILIVFLLVAVVVATHAQSEQTWPWFGTHYQPGNTSLSLEGGVDFGPELSLAAVPAAELIVAKFRPFDVFSVDLGVAARGLAAFRFGDAGTTITVGGAPLLMFHAGLREMTGAYGNALDMLDFYTGFGVGYLASLGADGGGSLAWANANGVNVFLSESFALRLGTSYFQAFGSAGSTFLTNLGIMLKIGPAEEIGETFTFAVPDMDEMSGEAMYATFSTFYALAAITGGYLPNDDSFAVGDGTVTRQSYVDGNDLQNIVLFRALLHDGAETSWWRYEFEIDDDSFAFEAEIDAEGEIEKIRYEDESTGDIVVYEPTDSELFRAFQDAESLRSDEEMASFVVGQERITVEAGTYDTDRLETAEDGAMMTWWLSDDVPGRLVQAEGETEESEAYSIELIEVIRGYTSPWGVAW